MNLYLISQHENDNYYDTYDSAVVAASTEEVARNTHPAGGLILDWSSAWSWCSTPSAVTVELIGTTDKQYSDGEIVLSSYNAG